MNLKTVLAAVAAAIVLFLLGWLIYGILLMDFMAANSTHYDGLMKEENMNLFLMFLANLSLGCLFAYVFQQLAKITTFGKGFIAGMIIIFFFCLSMDLNYLGMMNLFNAKAMVVDVIAFTIMGGIAGGVTGWILGYGKKAAA